ncbi:MAG TPA: hypothetical protein VMM16_08725 [Verrucomicrobiae bacterium]|nr:hypothetical protein [Verrucomicrobiae bacterium]
MSALASRNSRPTQAVAIAIPYTAGFEVFPMRDRLAAIRDTLIVLGLQIVFRATTILRHLNY